MDGGWVVNGAKKWVTSAHVSDYILLLVRTEPAIARRHEGLSLFLLPARTDGVSLSPLGTLGMRALSTFDMTLKDAFIADEWLVGEAGRAWYMLLPTLNNERLVLLGLWRGMLDGILETALAYVKEREAFGKRIGGFQIIQHSIADIAAARARPSSSPTTRRGGQRDGAKPGRGTARVAPVVLGTDRRLENQRGRVTPAA